VDVVEPGQPEAVLDFVAREFPEWLGAYQGIVDLGDSSDIVAATDASGTVVASLALYSPWSHPARLDIPWQGLLGNDLGGPGVVGVAAARQRQGIGTVLMARANEILSSAASGTAWSAGPRQSASMSGLATASGRPTPCPGVAYESDHTTLELPNAH
jgi:hypothetical protein